MEPDDIDKVMPLDYPTRSPVSVLKKNDDGTLLIKIKPQVYITEMGCETVMDEMGKEFAQMHYVIDFYIESKYYYTIWGVLHGGRPPIDLDRENEYLSLIQADLKGNSWDKSIYFEIIKIWDGDRVVFVREKEE